MAAAPPDLTAFLARARPPADRVAVAALVLLGVALHARGVTIGYLDQDLTTLETVVRTSFEGLMRGGALAGGFTPLSRELYLWWWGKTVGIGALGFHLLSVALAAATAAMLYRLGERWAGARTGLVAAGLWIAFAPLGSMLAAVSASRELVAVTLCAAALLLYTRERWFAAGALTGLAVLSRESAWTLPLGLALADVCRAPRATARERVARLAPAWVAGTAGIALLVAGGPHAATRGVAGAGAPLEFALAWIPAGSLAGLGLIWKQAPWWVMGVVLLAPLVVPFDSPRQHRAGEASPGLLPAVRLGVGLLLLALLPVLFLPGPRRVEVFGVAALGACLAVAAGLALLPAWAGRLLLPLLALASLGIHSLDVPNPRLASYAAAAREASRTAPLIAALQPWCRSLAATPVTFAAAIPPDSAFRLALGPGACVECRNPAMSIRFLAEMRPAEAAGHYGVLRYDPTRGRFLHEQADAQVRARIGEGLLVYAKPEVAAACFAAAIGSGGNDAELSYPLVVSLAAAGDSVEAMARWQEARARGRFPAADTLAMRLLGGFAGREPDSLESVVVGLAGRVVADPLVATSHLALGRKLLEMGRARSATIELSVGSGISRRSQDVYWLALGYDALGARPEALEAYRTALSGGLDSTTYRQARARFVQLMQSGTPLGAPENAPAR